MIIQRKQQCRCGRKEQGCLVNFCFSSFALFLRPFCLLLLVARFFFPQHAVIFYAIKRVLKSIAIIPLRIIDMYCCAECWSTHIESAQLFFSLFLGFHIKLIEFMRGVCLAYCLAIVKEREYSNLLMLNARKYDEIFHF